MIINYVKLRDAHTVSTDELLACAPPTGRHTTLTAALAGIADDYCQPSTYASGPSPYNGPPIGIATS